MYLSPAISIFLLQFFFLFCNIIKSVSNYSGFCRRLVSKYKQFSLLSFWSPNGGSLFQAFLAETLGTRARKPENRMLVFFTSRFC